MGREGLNNHPRDFAMSNADVKPIDGFFSFVFKHLASVLNLSGSGTVAAEPSFQWLAAVAGRCAARHDTTLRITKPRASSSSGVGALRSQARP
jgi:hypothetical protein